MLLDTKGNAMNIDTIMVVDDDEVFQMLAENTIEEFDSKVKIIRAYDGQEALDILDELETQPSIILLDVNMPKMNGFGFLEKYKARDNRATVVAMHTSSSDDKDRQRAEQYGFVKSYFSKPIEVSDLEMLRSL